MNMLVTFTHAIHHSSKRRMPQKWMRLNGPKCVKLKNNSQTQTQGEMPPNMISILCGMYDMVIRSVIWFLAVQIDGLVRFCLHPTAFNQTIDGNNENCCSLNRFHSYVESTLRPPFDRVFIWCPDYAKQLWKIYHKLTDERKKKRKWMPKLQIVIYLNQLTLGKCVSEKSLTEIETIFQNGEYILFF